MKDNNSKDLYYFDAQSYSDEEEDLGQFSHGFGDTGYETIVSPDDKYLALVRAYSHNNRDVANAMIDFLDAVVRLNLMRPHNKRKSTPDLMWNDSAVYSHLDSNGIIAHVNEEEFDPCEKTVHMLRAAVFSRGLSGFSLSPDFSVSSTGESLSEALDVNLDSKDLARSFWLQRHSILKDPQKRVMRVFSSDVQRRFEKKNPRVFLESLSSDFVKGKLPEYVYPNQFTPSSVSGVYLPNLDSKSEWLKRNIASLISVEYGKKFVPIFLNDNLNHVSQLVPGGYVDCVRDEDSLYSVRHHPAFTGESQASGPEWFWREIENSASSVASAEFKIASASGDDPDYQRIRETELLNRYNQLEVPAFRSYKGTVQYSFGSEETDRRIRGILIHSLKSTTHDLKQYPDRIHVMDLAAANATTLDGFEAITTPDFTKVVLIPTRRWASSGFARHINQLGHRYLYASPYGTAFTADPNYKVAQLCVALFMCSIDKKAYEVSTSTDVDEKDLSLQSLYDNFRNAISKTNNKKFLAMFGNIGNAKTLRLVSKWLRPFSKGTISVFVSGLKTRRGSSDLASHRNVEDEVTADYMDTMVSEYTYRDDDESSFEDTDGFESTGYGSHQKDEKNNSGEDSYHSSDSDSEITDLDKSEDSKDAHVSTNVEATDYDNHHF